MKDGKGIQINIYTHTMTELEIWGAQIATLIYISRQPPPNTHTHTHTYIYIDTHTCFFLIYRHTFYFISYIYIHTKKKSLVFSIKIIFDGDLS